MNLFVLKSKHIITAIVTLFLLLLMNYSYSISTKIKKIPTTKSKIWYLGKGDYFKDTVQISYTHLVSDFPLLELIPNSQNLVETEGYLNSKRFLTTDLKNDTLYVLRTYPDSDTILVASEGDYPIIVRVGAQLLESITIREGGHIDIPAKPYGSNPNGEIVYKPNDWKKYLLSKNDLKLILEDNGYVKMFAQIDNLSIEYNKKNTGYYGIPKSEILGNVNKLSIRHPEGYVNLDAPSLICDSLIVYSKPDSKNGDDGVIRTRVSSYLEANLLYDLNIAYTGQPIIRKSERSLGRVIDTN